MRKTLLFIIIGFVVFCGILVVESGLFCTEGAKERGCILLQQTTAKEQAGVANVSADKSSQIKESNSVILDANHAEVQSITLGSTDPKSGFKFELVLSSQGAAIEEALLSEFDNRDPENPQPLRLLSPVRLGDGGKILSMANKKFVFVSQKLQLSLDNLHWRSLESDRQSASFEAIIKNKQTGSPVVKLTKSYKVYVDSYQVDCSLTVENLSSEEQKVRFDLGGPLGIGRESPNYEMRKAIAGFRNTEGKVTREKLEVGKLRKAATVEDRSLRQPGSRFLWTAAVNKYFAAILRPVPAEGEDYSEWVSNSTGSFYNPDGDVKANSGDETVGVDLKIATNTLAAAGQLESTKTYAFQLYLVPKDKRLFDSMELYRDLGFIQTIDFRACCCPVGLISPIAFGILGLMEWLYNFIPNYGVIIIILVFIIRIVIHPLTKKSQVSMHKMSSLAPRAEEIKKKYANNKTEMNKQLMALYREQGASPIMGMLPMVVQMPIWISLYSAIYASIALRGAAFLPFWITDLSAPDALFRFSTITVPLLGWKINSFNLLPLLMGLAFYLQQKLMPKQAAAAANPQVAQQQKMMMIMMPIMFPVLLYKAPAGLNLYIMASTFAGVIEQYIIKKHIREREQLDSMGLVAATSKTGGKVKKKKPKPFYRT